MLSQSTYHRHRTFNAPRKRIVFWTILAAAVALLATVVAITASANPPSAAEIRIQGWVNELQQERLTAQRHNAQRELENAGADAVPALLVALRSDNMVLRRNAADMLGFIASPGAISGLQFALANDAVPAVRRNAAWALGEVNSFAAIEALQRASILDRNALVRETAQDSLARIRSRIALAAGIDERELSAYAVAPSSAEVMYVATRRNLVITQDGGKTWETYSNTLPSLTNVLAVSPADPMTLYAGVDGLGMYKSVDGGREWTAINHGLKVAAGARFLISAITIDPTDPQRIVIATGVMLGTGDAEFYPTGILLSNNGGTTWNVLNKNVSSESLTQLALKGSQVFSLTGKQVVVYPLD